MSEAREINGVLKQVLELGPPVVFFLIYLRIRDDVFTLGGTEYSGFIVATLTAWFNDERFFKMKTSIVYGFFALLLGIGLARGQSWLAYVLNDAMPMRHEGWMILTRRLCAMFAALAVANEVIWRTMSTDAWVKIETFGFPAALIAFLFWQITALQGYLIEDETEEQS